MQPAVASDSAIPGALMTRVAALYLALGAIMVGTGVLLCSLGGWWYLSMLSEQLLTARLLAATLVAQLLLLPGAWWMTRLLWRRSRELLALPPGERLATRVVASMLRTAGECWALMFAFSSLAVAGLVAIAGDRLVLLIPDLARLVAAYPPALQAAGFLLLAIAIAAAGASLAVLSLLMSGFVAEGLLLWLQIAEDVRELRQRTASVMRKPLP